MLLVDRQYQANILQWVRNLISVYKFLLPPPRAVSAEYPLEPVTFPGEEIPYRETARVPGVDHWGRCRSRSEMFLCSVQEGADDRPSDSA